MKLMRKHKSHRHKTRKGVLFDIYSFKHFMNSNDFDNWCLMDRLHLHPLPRHVQSIAD